MNRYPGLQSVLSKTALWPGLAETVSTLDRYFTSAHHGEIEKWENVISRLAGIIPGSFDLHSDAVRIGRESDVDADTLARLKADLLELHPWRKGPFELFGMRIDTEWRSDWKWQRLAQHLSPLKDRLVLDVGCANGYYGWRMAGEGAKLVLGIDPSMRYVYQYFALRKYIPDPPVYVLPLSIDDMPGELQGFDTVFSMGVLYHRKSPLDHLAELAGQLRTGGELVLETLVIEGGPGDVLAPPGRYAKMRNVWFIPSVETLLAWVQKSGYRDVKVVDTSVTTTEEQRSTEWMQFESLPDFLDPGDNSRTIEGWPAPRRAVIIATKD